ncbi:MAG TPA: sigma 54-interacting transcriptional regulator [Candidatus Anaerotruncus excrementipullorum]|uniref:Sigma 54-interacting transcriptional regulator n=1 Tax=Candidatus Anaerotruncus excrementipullorum TaxID=2838465 RepID=A0A9D1WP19_9FIRM|nr:sigma 54-interacting transcriptional regulator [Candidatus Anaerotruncus excrementipullorum]
MEQTVALARSYAKVNSNVLIQGETGTGKELLAQSIHSDSERFMGPFVAINCSTFTENLLESELFGYSEGTFTGGLRGGKIGLFELADGGTLFLDEVSEIPLNFQGKLLRVLQEREVRRLGDNRIRKIDVRIISATNRDLLELSLQGGFRKDLLYRLEVLKLTVPPLRERQEDIPLLLSNFIEHYRKQCRSRVQQFSPEAVKLLQRHPFYGNVRELGNLVERLLVIYSAKEVITGEDLQAALELPARAIGLPTARQPRHG